MATLLLGAAGTALGGGIGGSFLGLTSAAIGGMIGSTIGTMVDSWIIASMQPGQRYEGARLDSLRVTSSTEGVVIPQLFGTNRVGGNLIWATDFREETETTEQGGKGGGGVSTTEYAYYASFAIGLCEGPIGGIGRVWVDGDLMDLEDVTWRWHRGSETQEPDPTILAVMGADATPAYRGTAYVVFEDLYLGDYGNRIPQITFEVFRPLAEGDTAEGLIPAVTIIPGTGEFVYATQEIQKDLGDEGLRSENANTAEGTADILVSLDRLEALAPRVESVSLVVSWFGTDLRAGQCQIKPGVEIAAKDTEPETWGVDGVSRGSAYLVSQDDEGRPVYGGTPADFAVVEAIQEIKARGLRITFYPFILMDVPGGNTLPDPYSGGAASAGQPAFPWRGRITCSPAPGYTGTVDKTAAAAAQVAAFFGAAKAGDFSVSGSRVSYSGPAGDWGFRRMILHYAHLCAAAGGVDAFLIGSEMRGLTTIRSGASTYPAVQQLIALAEDVRAILGAGTKIGYAADWSEYFGHHPGDGSGDVFYHLDPLWAHADIDFVGIDNYMPLSDWRDGVEHADYLAGWPRIYHRAYLESNIEGGEGFDWFYASEADREAQVRTPIVDGAAGKHWVFRYKDIRSWWANQHRNRPGGVEADTPTPWVPQSKPIRFTELGCPAIDRGTNQPNVFVDPKSSESFTPYFSRGWQDSAIQRAYLEAVYLYWAQPTHNPASTGYAGRMLDLDDCAVWTWDARPFPFFPQMDDIWSDSENWRLGHWLTGRLGASLAALVRYLCRRAGLPDERIDVTSLVGTVDGFAITAIEGARTSLSVLARHFGFDACESEGVIRFVMRGQEPSLAISHDDLVETSAGADIIEFTRAQETELPQALKWQVSRNDDEFDAVVVEARRITVESTRIASETFPLTVAPEEAEQRCRRALMEAWVGRETATFALPPSRLALDPTDVVRLAHDGRFYDLRMTKLADNEARNAETIRQDSSVFDAPAGNSRPVKITPPVLFAPPRLVFMDLPLIAEGQTEHRPMLAAHANPWPGQMAVWRSASSEDFARLTTFTGRSRVGTLAYDLYSGPVSRLDLGNQMIVDLSDGPALVSVTDTALFGGANAFALETGEGWEIIQAGRAELLSEGRYRLTRLLRGQRGTEFAMAPMAAAGARVVVLGTTLAELPIGVGEVGLPLNWRVGPAVRAISDRSYVSATFGPGGAGRRPFSVAHIEQPWRKGRVPGDLTLRWTRRSRSLAADSWEAAEVPLAEEAESYQVEIMDGAAVARYWTVATTAALYSAAQQTADWGSTLGPGDTLDVRIAQLSTVYGPGPADIVTLYF